MPCAGRPSALSRRLTPSGRGFHLPRGAARFVPLNMSVRSPLTNYDRISRPRVRRDPRALALPSPPPPPLFHRTAADRPSVPGRVISLDQKGVSDAPARHRARTLAPLPRSYGPLFRACARLCPRLNFRCISITVPGRCAALARGRSLTQYQRSALLSVRASLITVMPRPSVCVRACCPRH